MGETGRFRCTAECRYKTRELHVGCGEEACVTLRRCPSCATVYAQFRRHEWARGPAIPEARCAPCGGLDLVDAPDLQLLVDASDEHAKYFASARLETEPKPVGPTVACPRCAAPLAWELIGLWD